MKVGLIQGRIKNLEDIASKLMECADEMRSSELELNGTGQAQLCKDMKKQFDITPGLLSSAAYLLNCTADSLQKQLDDCEVEIEC